VNIISPEAVETAWNVTNKQTKKYLGWKIQKQPNLITFALTP
jgi:hypothetical protein